MVTRCNKKKKAQWRQQGLLAQDFHQDACRLLGQISPETTVVSFSRTGSHDGPYASWRCVTKGKAPQPLNKIVNTCVQHVNTVLTFVNMSNFMLKKPEKAQDWAAGTCPPPGGRTWSTSGGRKLGPFAKMPCPPLGLEDLTWFNWQMEWHADSITRLNIAWYCILIHFNSFYIELWYLISWFICCITWPFLIAFVEGILSAWHQGGA